MIININDMRSIADIQDKFSSFFPFLKIEFYNHPHHWYEESETKTVLPTDKFLGDIRHQHEQGNLAFYSWFKTGELEQVFRKKFNLNVQVLRLEGSNWIQTVDTDKLTLKEQNEIGRATTIENKPLMDPPVNNNIY
jgi:hypothetical protein